jgi:hypothetical protein
MILQMIPSGWMISVPLLLPNLLWMAYPPAQLPTTGHSSPLARVLGPIETAGRIAVFTIPFFLNLHLDALIARVCLIAAVPALLVYYIGWARYFVRGRAYDLLSADLLGIPVPLAVAPTIYLLAGSALLQSVLLAIVTALFGAVHLYLALGQR